MLDPIFSLRRRVRIEPGGSAVVAFTTAFADTRDEALALADQFREIGAVARAFELAWAHSQVEHRHPALVARGDPPFQRLASHIIYAGSALCAPARRADRATGRGSPALWRYGISGDLPIVLVRVASADELALARQLLAAHAYLRLKGLEFDLVILDEEPASYLDELNRSLSDLIRASDAHDLTDKPGGVFVRKAAHIPDEDEGPAPGRGPRRAGRRPGPAGQPARPHRARRCRCPQPWPRSASRADWHETEIRAPPPTCSSTTAWGASPPTAASIA